jgi:ABC-2 type transport system permease protein
MQGPGDIALCYHSSNHPNANRKRSKQAGMIKQIWIILRKEWLDIRATFFSTRNLMPGLASMLVFSCAASVYEPARMGPEWLHSPEMIFFLVLLIPLSSIGFIGPDSFAGERRRNTLEPLLATPIPDPALLFGKVGITGLIGWGGLLLNLALGFLTVNLAAEHEGLLFYPPDILAGVIGVGLLISFLLAIVGVGSSLYSHTLLEAQNKMGMWLFLPMILAATFISPYMPAWWKMPITQWLSGFGRPQVFVILLTVFFVIDGISIGWLKAIFKRKQLIL